MKRSTLPATGLGVRPPIVAVVLTLALVGLSPPPSRPKLLSTRKGALGTRPPGRSSILRRGGWPKGAQAGTSYGHVHMGTCFPLNQTVSGVVPFDIELVLHENPGALFHIQPFLCRSSRGERRATAWIGSVASRTD